MSPHLTAVESSPHRGATAPIKVLIADDHPLIVAGIRRTIECYEDIEIVGEARSGSELLALVERRRPDLVLTDLDMPDVAGCECLEQLRAHYPELKIVVLSAHADRPTIDAALCAGANAYIVKSADTVDIASVMRQAFNSAVYMAPVYAPTMRAVPTTSASPTLTERERSILSAVSAGLTTAAISRDLWVSEHTVKFHLTNIYRKLGVSNRAGAVRYAFEHDLVAA